MADTFSSSLDVSSLLEEPKTSIGLNPKPPLSDFVEEIQQQEFAATEAAARWSKAYDPGAYAEAQKLAPGVPPEIGVRQLELLKDSETLAHYKRVFETSPQLRGYFAEQPKDLAYAKPDELDNISGIPWMTYAGKEAIDAGYLQFQAAMASNRIASGQGSISDRAFIDNYSGDRNFGARGFWDSAFVEASKQVPQIGLTAAHALRGALVGSVGGGATGAAVGSVVPGPGTVAGGFVGMIAGAEAGGTLGAYTFQQQLQTGLSRLEFQTYRDENGKPLEPALVEIAAQISGSGGALLETVGFAQLVKTIPGGDRIIGLISKEGMGAALKQPTVRAALLNFAKNTGLLAGTEITTEVLQQALQITAGEIAKQNSEGAFAPKTPEEIAGELGQAAYQSAQVMLLLGPLASGTRFGADIVEMHKSKRELKSLNDTVAHLEGNELVERAPQIASKLIDRQTGDQKVFIPAQEFVELYQSEGKDIYGPALPNWRERLDEALLTGGSVETTLGEYIAYIGKDPKENPLAALVRTSPQGYSLQEMELMSDAQDLKIQSEVAQASKTGPMPSAQAQAVEPQPIPELEALKKQIAQAGFAPPAIEAYSQMLTDYFNTMAHRTGRSPSEFFNEFSLEIQRGLVQNLNEGNPNPDQYFQGLLQATQEGARGSIQFDGTKAIINFYDGANMSTLLHESGHFFLNTLRGVSGVSPELGNDWAIVKKHLKIGEDGKITRDQHEQFAKMAEAYFMEGKAPSPELRNAFAAFTRWLKTIYRNIRSLGGKVNPEISAVFDRMLVTEQRFQELATDTAYAPLFKTAEEMGVSPEEYLEYQKLVEDLRDEAQVKTIERIAGQAQRQAKGWQGEILKQLTAEAEAKLRTQAPYVHAEAFKSGKISIDPKAFADKYGKDSVKAFPAKAFNAKGFPPEVASELLGYPTSDEMVYDFVNAPPIKQAAKELAAKEMATRYEADFGQSPLMTLAIKQQFADEGRLTILGKEFQALSRRAGREVTDKGPKQLATQIARNNIYAKKVKDLSEVKTQAAVRRSAAMAEAAMLKGDWRTAADWKRKQILAQAIDNETQVANRAIEKIRQKAARYSRTSSSTVDPKYMEQIRGLVEKYEFAKISGKKLQKRENLRAFLEQAAADGQVVLEVPDRLFRDADRVSFKELSVEDLIGLGDTLDNLEHLGRTLNKIKTKRKAEEFARVKEPMLERIRSRPTKPKKMNTYTEEKRTLLDTAAEFHASWLKPEMIIEWLDAGDIKGPLMENIFQPIADAQNLQNELNLQYNGKITKIFEEIDSSYLNEVVLIPSLGTKMTRQEIYAIALNTGNESNRKKMLEGELWNESQLSEILSHLDGKDWKRIQSVWNTLDSLWEKIAAMEKRLTGVAPPKIEARQFTNQHGTFEGGYYPVVYDFKSQRGLNLIADTTPTGEVFASQLFSPQYLTPGTSHKHTVKRTKVAKPIKLELAVLPGHLQKVIHDLAYREPVRAAYKLLWDPDIKRAISDVEGEAVYSQLQHWLRAVATERAIETDSNVRYITRLRTGATMFGMGYRLITAVAQPLGFFASLTRVGKVHLGRAIYQMARHPQQTLALVNGLSGELKSRFNTQERDIHDTVRKLSLKSTKLDIIRGYAFHMIGVADKFVATATWLGAYQDYLSKHPADQDTAIMHADRTVRLTQGTGTVKDMAKITNNGEILKLFTMFYSFFSAQYNMQVDLTRKTINDINAGDMYTILTERLPQWAYLVVFPAIFGALLTGQGPDEDENELMWALRKTLLYPVAAMPFVRDIVPVVDSGYAAKFTPASKFVDEASKALKRLTDSSNDIDERLVSAIKPAATSTAIFFKLPAGQAINTIEGLWKGLSNGDFEYKDLVYGRRDK